MIFLFFICDVKGLHWAASASRMLHYVRVNLEMATVYIPSLTKFISPWLII